MHAPGRANPETFRGKNVLFARARVNFTRRARQDCISMEKTPLTRKSYLFRTLRPAGTIIAYDHDPHLE